MGMPLVPVDLGKPERHVELVGVSAVRPQRNRLKTRARMLENSCHQGSSDTAPSMGGRDVKVAEPANSRIEKGVSIEPANAGKLLAYASDEECFTGKDETIGSSRPVPLKALQSAEAFGHTLRDKRLEIERQRIDSSDS